VSRYEAVLFDFDGVLADTEPVHFACWREVLAPFGIQLAWPVYAKECIGVSDRLMIQRLCHEAKPPVDLERLWSEYPRKKQIFRERIAAAGTVFCPDTVNLITCLSVYKLGVVSSSGRSEIEPPLVQAGIRDRFGAVVCGSEVPNLKPAPDPYLRAADLLGVRTALVVEDSDAGEESGRAAGFDVLRVTSPLEVAARVRERLGL